MIFTNNLKNISLLSNSLKSWSKIPIVNWTWLKLVETLSSTIWWKIKDLKLSKLMCLWFKVSLPPLTSIKKACSFKSILCPDAYNKKLSLIISFTSKKKAGKKAKSRTKSLVNPWLLIMETIEFTRLLIWISPRVLWITSKLTTLPNPWLITTRRDTISPSPTPNNLFWFTKESSARKTTNKCNNYI